MSETVPDQVKRERLEQLLDLQRTITLDRNEARIGTVASVLIDNLDGSGAIGRTKGQALEVDGVVQIASVGRVRPGEFVKVRLTGAIDQDLSGEILSS
jgi:ribosomal protein S12 methylthiotransferase